MTQDLAKDQAWKPMVSFILIGHNLTLLDCTMQAIFLWGVGRGDSPYVFACSCPRFSQDPTHHSPKKIVRTLARNIVLHNINMVLSMTSYNLQEA